MYLKSLRINGFKSFADPTLLSFQPGVTAIVGPNGCGKSNIADSIRWVLGEQSAKALRGGRMQDVIFEGTDQRSPVQLCEVALTLADCERDLGAEFNEVEVTRRVARDGSSDYFLNGKSCRLKDIQKLFMDTGVGRSSYSVMAQGQIDQILSSKPEERREIFEEAAGITRYKSQRREALSKLAQTDANLTRVNDVLAEVSRQIGSLRRQAAKAVRYKLLSTRMRHLDLAQKARQHGLVRTQAEEAAIVARRLGDEVAGRRAEVSARQAEVDRLRGERSRAQERLQTARQSVFDLRQKQAAARAEAELASVRATGLAERLAASAEEQAALERELAELGDQAEAGGRDRAGLRAALTASERVFGERQAEAAVLDRRLAELEQAGQKRRLAQLEADSQLVRARAELNQLEVDQKTLVSRRQRLEGDLAEARAALATAQAVASEARARLAGAESAAAATRAAAEAARGRAQASQQAVREAQKRLQEADRAAVQVAARLRALQQLAESFEGFGEGAKALLQGRLPDGVTPSDLRRVAPLLRARPTEARALEALLGAAAEVLAVGDGATAVRLAAHLASSQLGRAWFAWPAPDLSLPPGVEAIPDWLRPAGAAFLPAAARATSPALESLFAACWVTDDLGRFLDWWAAHPAFSFLLVATTAGDLVDRRGLVHGGSAKGRNRSLIQRGVEIQELEGESAAASAAVEELRRTLAAAEANLATGQEEAEARRREVEEAGRNLSALAADDRNAARGVVETETRWQRLEREAAELDRESAESAARVERLRRGAEESTRRSEEARAAIGAAESELAALRAERDQRRDALAAARLDLAEHRQRLELLERGLGDLARRREDLTRRRREASLQTDLWAEQRAQLEATAAARRAGAEELGHTLAVATQAVEEGEVRVRDNEAALLEAESGLVQLRSALDAVQVRWQAEERRLQENQTRAEFLAAEVRRDHDTDVGTVDWRTELWRGRRAAEVRRGADLDDEEAPDLDATAEVATLPTEQEVAEAERTADWEAVAADVRQLQARLSGLGPVNLVAIEEYRDLRQRHDFLSGQTTDLQTARGELLGAIDEINRISQQQFRETFEQVRRNFAHTFQTLFGGGVVELQLVDNPADPLESGVEITAQPPGTKLRGLTLLSGGQKALTAVALLFAIYLVKPSPFCLLDELDAPLDESNIGRFTGLLRQFSGSSQFLIITHSKRTLAAADAVYGVTMEERGVSRVVSMRFHRDRADAGTVDRIIAAGDRGGPAAVSDGGASEPG